MALKSIWTFKALLSGHFFSFVCLSLFFLYILFCLFSCIVLHNHHLSCYLMCSFDLWKKGFCTYAQHVFPMKDLYCSSLLEYKSTMFSGFFFFLWNMKREWRIDRCFWNLTIAVQNSAFWILNEMMNRFAPASAEAGFALRNMGSERQSFVVVRGQRLWILLLSVEI